MKTFWISGDSPFKSAKSINAIIFSNISAAQTRVGRPLTRQEIMNLIKLMKEKKFFESKQDSLSLFNTFISVMKDYKAVTETRPTTPSAQSGA